LNPAARPAGHRLFHRPPTRATAWNVAPSVQQSGRGAHHGLSHRDPWCAAMGDPVQPAAKAHERARSPEHRPEAVQQSPPAAQRPGVGQALTDQRAVSATAPYRPPHAVGRSCTVRVWQPTAADARLCTEDHTTTCHVTQRPGSGTGALLKKRLSLVLGHVSDAFGHPVRHRCLHHQTWPASGSSTRARPAWRWSCWADEPERLPLAKAEWHGRRGRPRRRPRRVSLGNSNTSSHSPGSHLDVRVLTRTLAAGPVGGVRPGEEAGVLLGSHMSHGSGACLVSHLSGDASSTPTAHRPRPAATGRSTRL
jgi:hypothetical protein